MSDVDDVDTGRLLNGRTQFTAVGVSHSLVITAPTSGVEVHRQVLIIIP